MMRYFGLFDHAGHHVGLPAQNNADVGSIANVKHNLGMIYAG